jgi:hypothetical protein
VYAGAGLGVFPADEDGSAGDGGVDGAEASRHLSRLILRITTGGGGSKLEMAIGRGAVFVPVLFCVTQIVAEKRYRAKPACLSGSASH